MLFFAFKELLLVFFQSLELVFSNNTNYLTLNNSKILVSDIFKKSLQAEKNVFFKKVEYKGNFRNGSER